jgi:hypothetical protein
MGYVAIRLVSSGLARSDAGPHKYAGLQTHYCFRPLYTLFRVIPGYETTWELTPRFRDNRDILSMEGKSVMALYGKKFVMLQYNRPFRGHGCRISLCYGRVMEFMFIIRGCSVYAVNVEVQELYWSIGLG